MRHILYVLAVQVLISTCFSQTIYGIKSRSSGNTETGQYLTPATLYQFADDGSWFTEIGPVNNSGSQIRADGLAYSSTLGLWCFQIVPDTSSTLYQIDPNTAAVVGGGFVLNDRQIFGAVFDRYGNLWAIDQTGDDLLKIDITSGTIIQETALTLDRALFGLSGASGDICFDAMGMAYLVHYTGLYQLNVHTGVLTELYQDTTSSKFLVGAVIPTNKPDTLIAFDVTLTTIDNDDIFVYDLANLSAPDYLFEAIINDYNAGRGDLAADIPEDLIIGSMFDADVDGWTGAGLAVDNLSFVQALPISYSAGGYLGIEDNDNLWTTFSAPAKYLGDKLDWLGGEISFDLQNVTAGTRLSGPAVILVGTVGQVFCSPSILPTGTWEHYSVALKPEGWHMNTVDGVEPNIIFWYDILSNLQAMYIVGDYVSGTETTNIDNIQMISGLPVDSNGSGFVDLEDFAAFATQWQQSSCVADSWCNGRDFDKSGTVDLTDLHFLLMNWLRASH